MANSIKKSGSDGFSSNITSSAGFDKHKMWSIIGVLFAVLVIGLLVGYPLLSGKKMATAGQATQVEFSSCKESCGIDQDCINLCEAVEVCDNIVDDDSDNNVDCDDSDCVSNDKCKVVCSDGTVCDGSPARGLLNDIVCGTDSQHWKCTNNGWVGQKDTCDCSSRSSGTACSDDTQCQSGVCSKGVCKFSPEDCTNKKDDNGDGKVDCADSLCKGKAGPEGLTCCSAQNKCLGQELCSSGNSLTKDVGQEIGAILENVCLGCVAGDKLPCSSGKKCDYRVHNSEAYDSSRHFGNVYGGICVEIGLEDCTNKIDDNDDEKTDCADSQCKDKLGPDGLTCCSAENKCSGQGEVCGSGLSLIKTINPKFAFDKLENVCLSCTGGGQLSCSADKTCEYKIHNPNAYDSSTDLGQGYVGICVEAGKLGDNCKYKKCGTDFACDFLTEICQKKEDYTCKSGDCFKKCTADADCDTGKGCFDYFGNSGHTECYLVAKVGETCSLLNTKCQAGAKCDSGTDKCVALSCKTNEECTNGFSCDQGFCVGAKQINKGPIIESVTLGKVYPFEYNSQIFSFTVSEKEQFGYKFQLSASNKGVDSKGSNFYLSGRGESTKVELTDNSVMYVALKEDKLVEGKPVLSLLISNAQEVCTDTKDNNGDGTVDCDDVTCATDDSCLIPFGACKSEFLGVKKEDASLSVVDYVCDTREAGSSPKWLLLNYYGSAKCTNDGECQPFTICEGNAEKSENKYCKGNKGYPCTDTEYHCARGYECDLANTKQCVKMTKEVYCSNKFDDDSDGKVDCADSECSLDSYCLEVKDSCSKKGDKIGKFVCDDRGIGLQWLLPNWGDCTEDSECGVLMGCDIVKKKCLGISSYDCTANSDCGSGFICTGAKCGVMKVETEILNGCYNYFDDDSDGKIDCADSECTTSDDCLLAKSCTQSQAEKGVVKKGKQYTHVCKKKGSDYSWFRPYENYCDTDSACEPGTVCQLSSYLTPYEPKGICYGGEGFSCGEVGNDYFQCAKGYDCSKTTKKCTSPNGGGVKIVKDLNTDGCVNGDDLSLVIPSVDLDCGTSCADDTECAVGYNCNNKRCMSTNKVVEVAKDLNKDICVNGDDLSLVIPSVDLDCGTSCADDTECAVGYNCNSNKKCMK